MDRSTTAAAYLLHQAGNLKRSVLSAVPVAQLRCQALVGASDRPFESSSPAIRETLSAVAHRWATHPVAIAFPVAFAAFLAVALLQGEKIFYYDAHAYWVLSETFVKDGHFSILNFENTGVRGYALPLIFHIADVIGSVATNSNSEIVMAFNAGVFALIGTVLAPAFAQVIWPDSKWSVLRRLALSAVILIFWRGYLNFPLSDFPALAAGLLTLIAVSHSNSLAWMLAAGASAGLALNFRPAYLLLVPVLLILLALDWLEQRGTGQLSTLRGAACFGMLALGFLTVSLPQSLSQHETFGRYNPLPGGSELAGLQYTEGLKLQRYESFVGGGLAQARMTYLDHHTDSIRAELDNGRIDDTAEYLEVVAQHPLTMAGVFLRHAVNGLDQRYTTPYVEQIASDENRPLRLGGFLIVFLALLRVAWPTARRGLGRARWRYAAGLLVVSATTLASAVETRFMLPVFVLCSMSALAPGWPNPIGPPNLGPRRYLTLALILATALVFFAAVGMIVSDATDSLRLMPTG
jgi:hypothetical protein